MQTERDHAGTPGTLHLGLLGSPWIPLCWSCRPQLRRRLSCVSCSPTPLDVRELDCCGTGGAPSRHSAEHGWGVPKGAWSHARAELDPLDLGARPVAGRLAAARSHPPGAIARAPGIRTSRQAGPRAAALELCPRSRVLDWFVAAGQGAPLDIRIAGRRGGYLGQDGRQSPSKPVRAKPDNVALEVVPTPRQA